MSMSTGAMERVDHRDAQQVAAVAAEIAALAAEINAEHAQRPGGVGTALPSDWSAADVAALIGRIGERGAVFTCRVDGRLVAFAIVQPAPAEPGTATMGVWVHEGYRRRGIGTQLAELGLAFARDAGYTKLRGTIPANNEPALSFFSSIGPIVQVAGGGIVYELPV